MYSCSVSEPSLFSSVYLVVLFFYVSVRPSACPYIHPLVYQSVHPSALSICHIVCLCIHQSVPHAFACLLIYLSDSLSIYWSVCLSSIYLSMYPSVCLPIYSIVWILSAYLSARLSMSQSTCISVHPYVCLPIYLAVHPFVYLLASIL